VIEGDRLTIGIYGPEKLKEKPRIVEKVREPLEPTTYTIGQEGPRARVRNSGKEGFQVAVYRLVGNTRELISNDVYPPMGGSSSTGDQPNPTPQENRDGSRGLECTV
jgi:hypothetical protein